MEISVLVRWEGSGKGKRTQAGRGKSTNSTAAAASTSISAADKTEALLPTLDHQTPAEHMQVGHSQSQPRPHKPQTRVTAPETPNLELQVSLFPPFQDIVNCVRFSVHLERLLNHAKSKNEKE